eukprot:PhF_6_TR26381/c0_g1_i1/m.38055
MINPENAFVPFVPHNYICITKPPAGSALPPTSSLPLQPIITSSDTTAINEELQNALVALSDDIAHHREAQRVARESLSDLCQQREMLWQRLRVIEDLSTGDDFSSLQCARDVMEILRAHHTALQQ